MTDPGKIGTKEEDRDSRVSTKGRDGRTEGRAWRQQVHTKITDIAALVAWFRQSADAPLSGDGSATSSREVPLSGGGGATTSALLDGVNAHLDAARRAAQGASPIRRILKETADMERAMSSLDAADDLLLRAAPEYYVRGRLPSIHSDARKYLETGDPRRLKVEAIHRNHNNAPLEDSATREGLIAASVAAHNEARKQYAMVRSFRRVLQVTAIILGFMAVGLAILGAFLPAELAPCFHPENKIVCPSAETVLLAGEIGSQRDIDEAIEDTANRVDVALIELLGLVAAAISSASSLRRIRGTSTPFSLPVALALLKLPTGALTAYAGLVLMRGNFVPGLSALDSTAQILAWAVVFGAAQQVVTGLVDRQARNVLDNVGGKTHSGRAPTEGSD
jgi:hypothetical protein